ncbi:MAG: ATP--corrinoid adenosyltransferase, partial [Vulcanococcus sp.]
MTLSTATPGSQAMHRGHLRPLPGSHPAPGQRSLRLVAQQEGLLQVHTAPFRGSFSGVFSQALRSAGLGSRVLISQFLKGGVDQGLERSVWLCGRLQWLRPAVAACLDQPAGDLPEPSAAGAADRAAVLEVWAYTR